MQEVTHGRAHVQPAEGQTGKTEVVNSEPLKPETVVRVRRHERAFVQIENATVQDSRLSWEARGLLAYLLSLPKGWRIRVSHLQTQGDAGRDALRRMLRQLQEFGYASGVGRESQERGERGRFGTTEIVVYETPALNPYHSGEGSPSTENPSAVNQGAGLPSAGLPSTVNPPTYKEQIPERTQATKDPPTQRRLRAGGASDGVGGRQRSRHELPKVKRWARWKKSNGANIDPDAVAMARYRDGLADDEIDEYLALPRDGFDQPERAARKCSLTCPRCFGSGMETVPGRGARRCPNLSAQRQVAA